MNCTNYEAGDFIIQKIDWLWSGQPEIDSRQRRETFFSSYDFQIQPVVHLASYLVGVRIKRPEREAEYSSPTSVEVKHLCA
jgi:hypothetical protein